MNYFTNLKELELEPRMVDEGIIRPARESDCSEMVDLYKTSFSEHILVKWGILSDEEKIREQIQEEEKKWIVFEKDGLKGSGVLEVSEWNRAAELARIVVDNEFRGNGAATEMCRYMKDISKDIGVRYMFAHARGPEKGMQRALQRIGFKVSGIMPVFYVNHEGIEVRENFVYMDRLINGGVDEVESYDNFIKPARELARVINRQYDGLWPLEFGNWLIDEMRPFEKGETINYGEEPGRMPRRIRLEKYGVRRIKKRVMYNEIESNR